MSSRWGGFRRRSTILSNWSNMRSLGSSEEPPTTTQNFDYTQAKGVWNLRSTTQFSKKPVAPGQAEFTTPGTFSWTAPMSSTSVCVVCVGGGGGPAASTGGASGAGGAGLGWKNNISVTPGVIYTVVVGAGGTRLTVGTSPSGGDSYFIDPSIVRGGGGSGGLSNGDGFPAGGTFTGDGGGNGGTGGSRAGSTVHAGGGAGAGGYSGNGGNGGRQVGGLAQPGQVGQGGGGGGGGGCGSVDTAGSGGGVGIYGEGASGAGGEGSSNDGAGGFGGSGGANASQASIVAPGNVYSTTVLSTPGLYGGGGCGADTTAVEQGSGGGGAVRIIWGDGRAFPSTNTGDV